MDRKILFAVIVVLVFGLLGWLFLGRGITGHAVEDICQSSVRIETKLDSMLNNVNSLNAPKGGVAPNDIGVQDTVVNDINRQVDVGRSADLAGGVSGFAVTDVCDNSFRIQNKLNKIISGLDALTPGPSLSSAGLPDQIPIDENGASESNGRDVPNDAANDQPEEAPRNENIACDDSDRGVVPQVFGTASETYYDIHKIAQSRSMADKCINPQDLNESTCQDIYISSRFIHCDNGCQAGVCVAPREPGDGLGGGSRPNPLAM